MVETVAPFNEMVEIEEVVENIAGNNVMGKIPNRNLENQDSVPD